MFAWLFLLLTLARAQAQSLTRWETGVQVVRLDLDSIGESPGGAGARVGYYVNRFVTVEAEANRYFEDPSRNLAILRFCSARASAIGLVPSVYD